jgi:hypothetical protein
VCFTIINIVVFLQPWLGDGEGAKKEGYFGLFEACKYYNIEHHTFLTPGSEKPLLTYRFICDGTWANLFSSLNPIATFAVGSSALINLVCIACFLVLFLFMNSSLVFTICGVLQLISSKYRNFISISY